MAASSCYGMATISSASTRGRSHLIFGLSKHVSPLKRDVKFREDEIKEANVKPTPPPKPKACTSFSGVMAFGGPAPERINGRLAMIGFMAAIGVELANGQDVFYQVQNGGVPWFLGTSVLLSLASLVPLFKGVTVESQSGAFMTSDAELWNGRFAMLGFVALAFTEFVKGGALL